MRDLPRGDTSDVDDPPLHDASEDIQGLDTTAGSWGDYPIDKLLIRHEHRTVHDVIRRIERNSYVMNPDFQRDFIWGRDKQSKLIESVVMRIPLPVFYLAEDRQGLMIVVDGLQRLSTFLRFTNNELRLRLPDRIELDGKRFCDLPPKLQNRIEDCNLIFYIIDSDVPERARLDIFERVNGGIPLTRQQMRNCLYLGKATRFLRNASQSQLFRDVTGHSLSVRSMRDREFVNRFCAFQILGYKEYPGDMDDFLARCLTQMNTMDDSDLTRLDDEFRQGLSNNSALFDRHAFRKHVAGQDKRGVINASLWDVLSTGLSRYATHEIAKHSEQLRLGLYRLLDDAEFGLAITYATSDTKRVRTRFQMTESMLKEILDADSR